MCEELTLDLETTRITVEELEVDLEETKVGDVGGGGDRGWKIVVRALSHLFFSSFLPSFFPSPLLAST